MDIQFELARTLVATGRSQDAAKELASVIGQAPEWDPPHALLGYVLLDLGKADEALASVQEAIRLDPEEASYFCALSHVYLNTNRNAEALEAAEEAVRLNPEYRHAWESQARVHLAMSKTRKALECAERGLALDPEDVDLINLRAFALRNLGEKDAAAAALDDALRHDPENSNTHANRGWAHMHAGEYKEAMPRFREALRLEPDNEWAREGMVEAMKAGTVVYRPILHYFLWMSRLPNNVQIGVIVGFLVLGRVLRYAGENFPQYQPLVYVLLGIYLAFIYSSWTARAMFNVVLRFHPFGKLVLTDRQRHTATAIAALLAGGLGGLAYWMGTQEYRGLTIAGVTWLLVIPLSKVSEMEAGRRRLLLRVFGAGLAVAGLAAILTPAPFDILFIALFGLGILIFTWVSFAVSLAR